MNSKKIRSITYNARLNLLFSLSVSILGFLIAIVLFSSYTNRIVTRELDTYSERIDSQIEEYFTTFSNIETLCSENASIQNALFNHDMATYDDSLHTTQQLLDYITETNSIINSIFLINKSGLRISSSISSDIYTNTIFSRYQNNGSFSFEGSFFCTIPAPNNPEGISMVFYVFPLHDLSGDEFTDRAVGGILCNLDQVLLNLSHHYTDKSIISIIFGNTFVSSSRPLSAEERSLILHIDKSGPYKLDGITQYCNVTANSKYDWKIKFVIPQDLLLRDVRFFTNISLFIILLMILLAAVSTHFTSKLLVTPIYTIANDIDHITHGNQKHLPMTHLKELNYISDSINTMLDSLEALHENESRLQTQLYQSMLAQTQAHIYAYRSQINPHFLFNTMECIRSMASYHHIGELESIISSLSDIFRYSLHSGVISTLNQELEHVGNYSAIMNMRVLHPCRITYELQEETIDMRLPSITLQPLIENAYTHGFRSKAQKSFQSEILIRTAVITKEQVPCLHILVRDNGTGITAERLAEIDQSISTDINIHHSSSIGLKNIYQRCRLMFEGSEITIRSEPGTGTTVELLIPQTNSKLVQILS